jgi:Kef-type K+ transport system membrane component KefB
MKTWSWLAAVVDVVLIVLFALIGRLSHGEPMSPVGLWVTAYPFLAGWAIAYVTSGAWARPLKLWPTGVVAWILTVFVGMAIRVATGQGVDHGNPLPLSFLIVATVVLGVFLLGWRAIAGPLVRRSSARMTETETETETAHATSRT